MKQILLIVVVLCAFCVWVKADCGLSGSWECTGGNSRYPIQGINFGNDEDDDSFSLFLQHPGCTVMQDGDYSVRGNVISVDLNGFFDDCTATEGNNKCRCYPDFRMKVSRTCLDIIGPSGERCQPARREYFLDFFSVRGTLLNISQNVNNTYALMELLHAPILTLCQQPMSVGHKAFQLELQNFHFLNVAKAMISAIQFVVKINVTATLNFMNVWRAVAMKSMIMRSVKNSVYYLLVFTSKLLIILVVIPTNPLK